MSAKIKSLVESVQKVIEWVISKAKAFSKKIAHIGHKPRQIRDANQDSKKWEDRQKQSGAKEARI